MPQRIRIGSVVRLKGKKRTAIVKQFYSDIPGGLYLSPALGGFNSWNVQDLEIAPPKESGTAHKETAEKG